jgi:hypothetical protein
VPIADIRANADKRAAAILWKKAQNAPESVDELVALLDDPGFEFTSEPHRMLTSPHF